MDCKGDAMVAGLPSTKLRVLLLSGLVVIALMRSLSAQPAPQSSNGSQSDKTQQPESHGKLPLNFEANAGRNSDGVESSFHGRADGLYLTSDGAVQARNRAAFAQQPVAFAQRSGHAHGQVGFGDDAVVATGLTGRGSVAANSADEDKLQDSVKQSEGGDLPFYANQRQRENDFPGTPDADPKEIRVEFSEVARVNFDADDYLIASANGGEFAFSKSVTSQENKGRRDWLAGHFTLGKRHLLNFSLSGDAPPQPLVNDPALTNSTYVGGSDGDAAFASVLD
jgi:hypothetical protein